MRSIQGKFTILGLIAVLICTTVIGGLGVWSILQAQDSSSDQILVHTCREEAMKIDRELLSVQGAVDSCADIALDELPALEDLKDEKVVDDYLAKVENIMDSIATNTVGVNTYYMRIDPDLSYPFAGFFHTRQGRESKLRPQVLTDILAFDEDDTEHVGWYYEPKRLGKPMWMTPYFNKNIAVHMISYIVPLYSDGVFCGVVGMDVDFNVMLALLHKMRPYETSKAALISPNAEVLHHPDLEKGTDLTEAGEGLSRLAYQIVHLKGGEGTDIVTYERAGIEHKACAAKLVSGSSLMLEVETAEVMRPVLSLLQTVVMAGVIIAIVVSVFVVKNSQIITRRLNQLVEVAGQVAKGNLDVELPEAGDDEVGILARSLDVTISNLRDYIEGMSDKAFKDDLTRVGNKAAYSQETVRLSRKLRDGEQFGVLVLDVNNLKTINDTYGHVQGDEYLQASCALVCHIFDHSPVFRIGGDEFVVVLEGEDFEHREELLAQLDARMLESTSQEDPWRRISIAKGLAVTRPADTSFEQVFERADVAMYENKRLMKE